MRLYLWTGPLSFESVSRTKPVAAVRITRPLNCFVVFGCVIVGGALSNNVAAMELWVAAFVAALITAVGNMVNDCYDIEADRINKPYRPLVTGEMGMAAARVLAVALIMAGLAMSVFLGPRMMSTAVAMTLLAYLYSLRLKGKALIGNIVISAMTAMTVVYGGMAIDSVGPTLAPATLVFMFMLCREVLKTVEDVDGDRATGARTITVVWGKMAAIRLFCVLAISVVPLSLLPWLTGAVSWEYLILVIPSADAVLMLAAFSLFKRPCKRNIKLALTGTKIASFFWVLAMLMGTRFDL